MRIASIAIVVLWCGAARADDSPASCPMHAQHLKEAEAAHARAVEHRGDEGMGFSQQRTAHHFTLLRDGGEIEVAVADSSDVESRDQIRQHLGHIAKAFSAGDFELPMFIHAQTPPGVPVLRRYKTRISYVYQPTPLGGRVRIATTDAEALAAVHAFLKFQIDDHRTGDSTVVQ